MRRAILALALATAAGCGSGIDLVPISDLVALTVDGAEVSGNLHACCDTFGARVEVLITEKPGTGYEYLILQLDYIDGPLTFRVNGRDYDPATGARAFGGNTTEPSLALEVLAPCGFEAGAFRMVVTEVKDDDGIVLEYGRQGRRDTGVVEVTCVPQLLAAAPPFVYASGGDILASLPRRRVTEGPDDDGCPALSPDGARIAFASDRSGTAGLWTIDGDGLRLLADGFGAVEDPAWSPDGTRVAFAGDGAIHVVDARTGALARVSSAGSHPTWSPDGTRPAFARDGALYIGEALLLDLPGEDADPAWSPDGSSIVFANDADGVYRLWIANADGSAPRPLTVVPAENERAPAWSPDGGQLLFTRERRILLLHLADGTVEDLGPGTDPDW